MVLEIMEEPLAQVMLVELVRVQVPLITAQVAAEETLQQDKMVLALEAEQVALEHLIQLMDTLLGTVVEVAVVFIVALLQVHKG
jgi:hypothetical protein